MVMIICPNCNKRLVTSNTNTDIEHDCSDFPNNSTLANEDIAFYQTSAEDFDGTFTQGRQNAMLRGIQNEADGTRAGIEGEKIFDETARGNNANIVRTRRKFTFIDLKNGG